MATSRQRRKAAAQQRAARVAADEAEARRKAEAGRRAAEMRLMSPRQRKVAIRSDRRKADELAEQVAVSSGI